MIQLLNLVLNENMKIYRRWRTWIMIILLVVMTGVVSYIVKEVSAPEEDWRAQMISQVKQLETTLKDIPEFARKEVENQLALAEEHLKRDLPPVDATFWGGVLTASNLIMLITIFTVIVAGEIVAGEFTWGTIKLLLIRPASRSKILLSKYISSFVFSIFLLLILLLSAILFNGIFYGFEGGTIPYLHLNDSGMFVESPLLFLVLSTYGYQCVELIMVVTLAFMISTVFRSSSFAIGFSIFLMLVGSSLTLVLMRYSWGKYYLFANTDLTQYLSGAPLVEGMTLGFSVAVLAVYFVIFNTLSWVIFNKRDVAG